MLHGAPLVSTEPAPASAALKCAVTQALSAPPFALSSWPYLLDLSCLYHILARSSLQWLYLAFEPLPFGLGFIEFSLFHLLWVVSNDNLLGVREKSKGWLMEDQWLESPQSPPLPHPPLTAGIQGSLPRRPESLHLTPWSQCVLTSLVRAEPAQGWCSPVLLLDPHTLWRPYGCALTCQVKQRMCFLFYNS